MNKYEKLFRYVVENCDDKMVLSFDEIENVLGFPIDHSFLNYKKELLEYGCKVKKISIKNKTIEFVKVHD